MLPWWSTLPKKEQPSLAWRTNYRTPATMSELSEAHTFAHNKHMNQQHTDPGLLAILKRMESALVTTIQNLK